jgi:dienelactone hydrolase
MRPTLTRFGRAFPALALALVVTLAAIGCGGGPDVKIGADTGPIPPPRLKWGKPAGTSPSGVVILIHGGGWQPNQFAYEAEMPLATTLQKQNLATVVVGYDAGATGFRQVEQVYKQARKRYPGLPICAHGISAGGTLALMLAAKEPSLTCVADLIGPTDLTTLESQGGGEVHDLAVTAFGADQLGNYSPVKFANQIKAKVLIVLTATDPIIPPEQGPEFVKAHPGTKFTLIPAGSTAVDWLHGAKVDEAGIQTAVQEPFSFIEQAINAS